MGDRAQYSSPSRGVHGLQSEELRPLTGWRPCSFLPTDLGRWDRYHYGSRFRDPRTYDQRYWHDAEYDTYQKDSYAHGDRWAQAPGAQGDSGASI